MFKKQLTAACFFTMTTVFSSAQDETPTPQWRPVYHFTSLKNWINDPNGLIYRNGVYHLYNQQNPFENKWGHMSWGHATSTDLVHWKHLPIAMPETIDKDTTWRFSGSAVWDKNNTSGFCKTGGCIVAVYTADQPNLKKESQFIAYSNDGGASFTNYEKNPVIDLNKRDFRDPSVSWNEQLKKLLMVVALPVEHKISFYTSPDLKNWDLLSQFGPEGYTGANWECPAFMQLPVEGMPNKKKWVLTLSAAGGEKGVFMQYYVGDFDGKTFKNDNPAELVLPVDNGDCFYAAIPWTDAPAAKKIFIGWMVPGPQETYPWRGQMSVPRDLSLVKTAAGLRLLQRPTAVIQNRLPVLAGNRVVNRSNITLSGTEKLLDPNHLLVGNAYWLDAVMRIAPGANAGFKICQEKDSNNKTIAATIVGYNSASKQWYVDKTNAGSAKMDQHTLLLQPAAGKTATTVHVQVLFDKSSLEVFFNDGEKVFTTAIFPGKGAHLLSAFSENGTAVLKMLKIWDLSKLAAKDKIVP